MNAEAATEMQSLLGANAEAHVSAEFVQPRDIYRVSLHILYTRSYARVCRDLKLLGAELAEADLRIL